jgi:hypothetical protein
MEMKPPERHYFFKLHSTNFSLDYVRSVLFYYMIPIDNYLFSDALVITIFATYVILVLGLL